MSAILDPYAFIAIVSAGARHVLEGGIPDLVIPRLAGGEGNMYQIADGRRRGFVSEVAIRYYVILALQIDVFLRGIPIEVQLRQEVRTATDGNNDATNGAGGELKAAKSDVVSRNGNSFRAIQEYAARGCGFNRDAAGSDSDGVVVISAVGEYDDVADDGTVNR